MSGMLQGHAALVTGSTSGIGRAIAERLAEQGAHVVVTGRREELGQSVVEGMIAAGGRAEFIAADLEDAEQCRRLVERAVLTLGRLDLLVNNAALIPRPSGGKSPDGPLHLTAPDFWDRMYRAGLRSVFLLSQLAVPHLLASPHGAIVHISSVLGLHGHGADVYSAIKGALIGLTRSMAVSYSHRLRVNCICPGIVLVERNRELYAAHPEMYEQAAQASLTRPGRPDDIAQCVLYLASPAGEYVSGAILNIDGGMSAKGYPLPLPAGHPDRALYPF